MSTFKDYYPDEDFLEEVADKVHRLFFPPAPPSHMSRFREQIQSAIQLQNDRDRVLASSDEQEREQLHRHYRRLQKEPRLRDKEAGPPEDGWVWDKWPPARKRHSRKELPIWGWGPEDLWGGKPLSPSPIPGTWGQAGKLPPEGLLPGQYLVLGIVHDNMDRLQERGRPRLLADFALPLAFSLMLKAGAGTPNEPSLDGFDCRSLTRALSDVKADLDILSAGAVGPGVTQAATKDLRENQGKSGDSDLDRDMARKRAKIKWLAEAISLVQTRPFMSNAAIAGAVKKHRSTLSRNETYKRAAKLARDTMRIPKGSKTAEGAIEAIDESPEDSENE